MDRLPILLVLCLLLVVWGFYDLKKSNPKESIFDTLLTTAFGVFEISALGRIIFGIIGFFIALGLMLRR